MDNDLTIDSVVFGQTNSAKSDNASVRRDTALGLNKPRELFVQHNYEKGSAAAIRSKIEFSQTDIDATTGEQYQTKIGVIVYQHKYTTSAQIDAVLAKLNAFLASTSPNFVTKCIKNKEI